MAKQKEAKDNIIECALFSDLHALKTLLCIRYLVNLNEAKNLRPHHNTCARRKALRFYCQSERSEESQCPLCFAGT